MQTTDALRQLEGGPQTAYNIKIRTGCTKFNSVIESEATGNISPAIIDPDSLPDRNINTGSTMKPQFVCLCVWIVSPFVSVPLSAQGSLTPPGPPGPVMKTLQQIEPRTDLATVPPLLPTVAHYIIESGS